MWLLDCDDKKIISDRVWLRPGKTYLFGRTNAEAGQVAISHNTISRKHLTITVDDVEQGQAYNLSTRSKLTITDLETKTGTIVNGQKLKGDKYEVEDEETSFLMGKCLTTFYIKWNPVVLTFSFSNKELQTQPLATLQQRFEHLDIKLLTEYQSRWTTHVVSKKRNTSKGLQALIHAKFIVTETFLDAIVEATQPTGDSLEGASSPLESSFEKHWPDAMGHLPLPGGEPVQHPDTIYAPDSGRQDIFEGYTFVFYEQSQYKNLLAPITDGGGKALLETVTPSETEVDDFIRYVKNVAGEKGLGSFEDGSEGKGVVLVRYVPAKGPHVQWYTDFFMSVSLRLDHRPIEQSEFLEAILIKNASILRRPLEVESSAPQTQGGRPNRQARAASPSLPEAAAPGEPSDGTVRGGEDSQGSSNRRPRGSRRPAKRRFAGFDDGEDIDMGDIPAAPVQATVENLEDEGGLFVSQEPSQSQDVASGTRRSQRKRQASAQPEDDLMDGMAPAAARFKRQRVEHGDTFASPSPEPEPASAPAKVEPKKKQKADILASAAHIREQEEERARREKEDLANLPDDVDLAEIRRLNIVEEMEVRQPSAAARTREQDIADGRWDPRWNGMKNFKKFRRRGEATGRQPTKVIIPLTEAKNKEFGVGDDYWLDDEESQGRKKTQSQSQRAADQSHVTTQPQSSSRERSGRRIGVVLSSDEDDEDERDSAAAMNSVKTQSSGGRTGVSQAHESSGVGRSSRQTTTGSSQGKRTAASEAPSKQPAKRQRPARKAVEVPDNDDSDDELKFRFGKRR